MEAAERGAVHYEHTPCLKCGDSLRYVLSNQCVSCTKDRARRHQNAIRMVAKKARGEA